MNALVGGKSLPTDLALAASPDAVTGLSRINDPRVTLTTVWAFHGPSYLTVQNGNVNALLA
jgi:hypothetical protein